VFRPGCQAVQRLKDLEKVDSYSSYQVFLPGTQTNAELIEAKHLAGVKRASVLHGSVLDANHLAKWVSFECKTTGLPLEARQTSSRTYLMRFSASARTLESPKIVLYFSFRLISANRAASRGIS
jgi:hypothetical protein